MRLSMQLPYAGGFKEAAHKVADLERAGIDIVWVGEAYSFDSISQMGYLAAKTDTVQIGAGIVNVFSRTAALIAMTFAGLDYVSEGRAICGLGASGPQVVEGFHGVPYEKPLTRIKEYIDVCRTVWKREPLVYDGQTVKVPLPEGEGTGLGKPLKMINRPVRADIPIWWASLTDKAVEATAEVADGWLPIMFIPERAASVWGDGLEAGLARRSRELGPLQIGAGGLVAIGEDLVGDKAEQIRDMARPQTALYVGGMGARGKNFYNDLARRYGYVDEAIEIQDLYLSGQKDAAAAKVPADWLEKTSFVGPASYVAERVAAYKEAGVTVLAVNPVGADAVKTIEQLRGIVDDA
jgi:F420-dependent oxidoreductase-like protein